MKTAILLMMLSLLLPCLGFTAELQHFDPMLFGKSPATPVRVLLDGGTLRPFLVQLDIKNAAYYAATVKYPPEITLDEARQSLNKRYAKWQTPGFKDDQNMALWRNTDKGFSIQLTKEENAIVIIYVSYKLMHSGEN